MEQLGSWKEIAEYVGKSTRTAQRWARRGFPVRRPARGDKPRVFAYKWEVDQWLHANRDVETNSDHERLSEEDSQLSPGPQRKRLFFDVLKGYYPDKDLRAQGLFRFCYSANDVHVATNIVTAEPWLGLSIPVDERDHGRFPLVMRSFQWPPALAHEIAELRAESDEQDFPFRNEPIYCLESFTPGQPQVASFSIGQYADYKVKLGRLEQELMKALLQSDYDAKRATRNLPKREDVLGSSEKLANFSQRLCAGGVHALIAFRRSGFNDYAFYVERRSIHVSTGTGQIVLAPSGMHQPTTKGHAREETSVAASVFRETYEELFGGKEAESEDKHAVPLWYMDVPMLKWFEDNRDRYVMEIVSFGLNLLDGTYEFGVLLVIADEHYWNDFRRRIDYNEEYANSETPVYSTLETARLAALLTDPRCADASLVVLVQGLRRLQKLEQEMEQTSRPSRLRLPSLSLQTRRNS